MISEKNTGIQLNGIHSIALCMRLRIYPHVCMSSFTAGLNLYTENSFLLKTASVSDEENDELQ